MRNLSTKVENGIHEKFLEYCNKKGMSINEALGEIVKFVVTAMVDGFDALPDRIRSEDDQAALAGEDLDEVVDGCLYTCPIMEYWFYNVFKQRESGE